MARLVALKSRNEIILIGFCAIVILHIVLLLLICSNVAFHFCVVDLGLIEQFMYHVGIH